MPFERMGLSRMLSTVTILILFIFVCSSWPLSSSFRCWPIRWLALAETLPRRYIASFAGFCFQARGQYFAAASSMSLDCGGSAGQYQGSRRTRGKNGMGALIQSIWNGGQALLDVCGLDGDHPGGGCLLCCFMIGIIWWPRLTVGCRADHQMTVRRLATEIDNSVSGFVRGQIMVRSDSWGLLCGEPVLDGVEFRPVDWSWGRVSSVSFPMLVPRLDWWLPGALLWYNSGPTCCRIGMALGIFAVASVCRGQYLASRVWWASVWGCIRSWLMFCLACFWLSVWICGHVDCGASGCGYRCDCALCAGAISTIPQSIKGVAAC